MNDLTTTSYFALLSTFLKAIGQVEALDAINKEEGILEWEVGNLIVRLMPHRLYEENKGEEFSDPDAMIIEVDLMLLDLENRHVNHDRFLILHQLNAASRMTTGIVAFISDEGMLFINKIMPLQTLELDQLSQHFGKVIKAAEELYQGWNELGQGLTLRHLVGEEDQEEDEVSPSPQLDQRA